MGNKKNSNIIFYEGDDTNLRIKTIIEDDNVWLTQKQLAELYGVTTPTINEHIKNVFEQTEQKPEQCIRKIRIVVENGKVYDAEHYNLDMIISIGYRVNSAVAIKFRQWATERLHEYIVKGFTMDDERLKQNGGRYFRELLQKMLKIFNMLFLFVLRIVSALGIALSHRGTCSACNYYKSRQVRVALCWIAVVSVLLSNRC